MSTSITKIPLVTTYCWRCHAPHPVDEKTRLCERCEKLPALGDDFARKVEQRRAERANDAHVALLVLAIFAIVAAAFWVGDMVMRGAR